MTEFTLDDIGILIFYGSWILVIITANIITLVVICIKLVDKFKHKRSRKEK